MRGRVGVLVAGSGLVVVPVGRIKINALQIAESTSNPLSLFHRLSCREEFTCQARNEFGAIGEVFT